MAANKLLTSNSTQYNIIKYAYIRLRCKKNFRNSQSCSANKRVLCRNLQSCSANKKRFCRNSQSCSANKKKIVCNSQSCSLNKKHFGHYLQSCSVNSLCHPTIRATLSNCQLDFAGHFNFQDSQFSQMELVLSRSTEIYKDVLLT